MCIVFIYNGAEEAESDYRLVIISNRDENFDRPAKSMSPWTEDCNVYGGRDLELGCEEGTWLAVTATHKKLGLLLNLPGVKKENARSRGRIVSDYVKCDLNIYDYINHNKNYASNCNDFIFLTVDFRSSLPSIKTYCNATDEIQQWSEQYLGFSNSLPNKPLSKVENGKSKLKDICSRLNKIEDKTKLIDELICLLRSKERHLPDLQLENRQPKLYKELSSIFVDIPSGRYGTRAHTIVLISKSGHVDLIEISMKSPSDVENPDWERNEFQFNIT